MGKNVKGGEGLKKASSFICAGFGGQGIMVLGKVLAACGMKEGLHVTWMPSYGAEVRGGTAHSQVKIAQRPIASPVVKTPAYLVIMNGPSLHKFLPGLTEGGLAVVNSSMVGEETSLSGRDILMAPLTEKAIEIGNVRVANMIAASILAERSGLFSIDTLREVISEMARGREELLRPNLEAVDAGFEISDRSK